MGKSQLPDLRNEQGKQEEALRKIYSARERVEKVVLLVGSWCTIVVGSYIHDFLSNCPSAGVLTILISLAVVIKGCLLWRRRAVRMCHGGIILNCWN